jgi:hypothetical protein
VCRQHQSVMGTLCAQTLQLQLQSHCVNAATQRLGNKDVSAHTMQPQDLMSSTQSADTNKLRGMLSHDVTLLHAKLEWVGLCQGCRFAGGVMCIESQEPKCLMQDILPASRPFVMQLAQHICGIYHRDGGLCHSVQSSSCSLTHLPSAWPLVASGTK